jgi:hypothetical protein
MTSRNSLPHSSSPPRLLAALAAACRAGAACTTGAQRVRNHVTSAHSYATVRTDLTDHEVADLTRTQRRCLHHRRTLPRVGLIRGNLFFFHLMSTKITTQML